MKPALIAVDGVDAAAILEAARHAIRSSKSAGRSQKSGAPGISDFRLQTADFSAGISRWDASGVFQELAVADEAAGAPSARVLLLLYAADLAFRLRWEIRPALAEGRTVAAAPYLDTASAFGRAAGVPVSWLNNLFRFAPRPADRKFVHSSAGTAADGFVGFSCRHMASANGLSEQEMLERTASHLREAEKRAKVRSTK